MDLARDALEAVIKVSVNVNRTVFYGAPPEFVARRSRTAARVCWGEVVTAEVRDRLGRAIDHADARVRDPLLHDYMLSAHGEYTRAREAARAHDALSTSQDDPTDGLSAPPAGLVEHVSSAGASADRGLDRIAELERDRPRR
jgi:hypothetical protein